MFLRICITVIYYYLYQLAMLPKKVRDMTVSEFFQKHNGSIGNGDCDSSLSMHLHAL
jgi:hypothetical protein